MEKSSLSMIIQDLKSKRDALSLAHEQLKKDNDDLGYKSNNSFLHDNVD